MKKSYLISFIILSLFVLSMSFACSKNKSSALPAIGNNGTMTISNITKTSLSLSWTIATDTETLAEDLSYLVVMSTSNNITTSAEIVEDLNGTVVQDWTKNINTIDVTGLNQATKHYFNVIVANLNSNKSAYTVASASTLGNIYMFSTIRHHGNLGGRSGADAFCTTHKPAALNGVCSNIRAFLSVSENDSIADLPANYSLASNRPIINSDETSTIADDWDDLLDGSIQTSLDAANIVPNSERVYSGSTHTGTAHANNCNGWESNNSAIDGHAGKGYSITDETWISTQDVSCDSDLFVLCVCW